MAGDAVMNWLKRLFAPQPKPAPEPPRALALTDVQCRYCLARLPQEDAESGECDWCWYTSKLAPDEWLKRLEAMGRAPKLVDGHLVPAEAESSAD